jgi:hypothetical protein
LGVPELRTLLWSHPGHGDGSLTRHPDGSGAHPAGGDAPGEPERRRSDHRPPGGDHPAAAARHAEALTEVRVHDRHRSEVEVDAFGSFVKKSLRRLEIQTPRRAGWARVGDVGVRIAPLALGWRGALDLRRMRSRRRGRRRPARARRAREGWLGSAMAGLSIDRRFAAPIGTRNRRESGGVRPWCPRPGWG